MATLIQNGWDVSYRWHQFTMTASIKPETVRRINQDQALKQNLVTLLCIRLD
jgi:hypothetical protein